MLFETKQDLVEERRIADILEENFNATLLKREGKNPAIDFNVFISGMHVGFFEVKCRKNYKATDIDPIYLSVNHKWKSGRDLEKEYGLPCVIAWEFSDGIYWINMNKINKKSCEVQHTGRTNRDGAGVNDIEDCWLVPLDMMTKVS